MTQYEAANQECVNKSLSSTSNSGGSNPTEMNGQDELDIEQADPQLPGSGPVPNARPTAARTAKKKTPSGDGAAADKSSDGQAESAGTGQNDFSMQALRSEVQACTSNYQEAQKCCNQPEQCGATVGSSAISPPSSNDPEGIKRFCDQMQYSGHQGTQANSSASSVCSTSHTGCSLSCEQSKKKWQGHLSSCQSPNCDPSRVQLAISTFTSRSGQCKSLKQNEYALADQGANTNSAALQSQYCSQQASMDPSSMMGDQAKASSQDQQDCSGANATKPECVDCSKFPNSPLCMGGNLSNASAGGGVDSADAGSGGSLSDYNVNTPATEGLPSFPGAPSVQAKAQDANAIPNGGGGMGGSSGAAGGSGFEDPAAPGGEGSSGYKTDVLSGEGGRSGYSGAAGGNSPEGSGGGFGGYGGGEEFKNKYGGLDLKQYLPGGEKDPSRSPASGGGTGTGYADISPSGVSMFNKISLRLSLKCKLKQLLGCE